MLVNTLCNLSFQFLPQPRRGRQGKTWRREPQVIGSPRIPPSLKGRQQTVRSSQKVLFVKRDPVFLKELHQLILEGDPGMMLSLSLDVAADLRYPGLAHGNGEVSSLPFESPLDLPVPIDPAGGVRLDEPDRRGNREVRIVTGPPPRSPGPRSALWTSSTGPGLPS